MPTPPSAAIPHRRSIILGNVQGLTAPRKARSERIAQPSSPARVPAPAPTLVVSAPKPQAGLSTRTHIRVLVTGKKSKLWYIKQAADSYADQLTVAACVPTGPAPASLRRIDQCYVTSAGNMPTEAELLNVVPVKLLARAHAVLFMPFTDEQNQPQRKGLVYIYAKA